MAIGGGRIERRLLCELTDDDVQSRGRMLAETVVQIDLVARQKREATKVFNQKLDGLGEEQRKLTDAIRDRAEYRIVACAVAFHQPCEGIKRIVRLDTGECIEEMPMTDGEKQLHLFASQAELAELFAGASEQNDAAPPENAAATADWPPDPAEPRCARVKCSHSRLLHSPGGSCQVIDCDCEEFVPEEDPE